MNRTVAGLLTALFCYAVYLILTTGSGEILLWSKEELIAGAGIALIAAVLSTRLFVQQNLRMANPWRWLKALGYFLGPFFFAMAKANLDVAYRVITGRINPGIVKISPELKTDLGITFMANSITLTPGTLTVDIDEKTNDLYIHWINVKTIHPECKDVAGSFDKWARRIAD
jgi:multicomponent Na+:H+ antiporter subunit E